MGFYVRTDVNDYKVRPWYVGNSVNRSYACGRSLFDYCGHFLRGKLDVVGREKIQTPTFNQILKVSRDYVPNAVKKEFEQNLRKLYK